MFIASTSILQSFVNRMSFYCEHLVKSENKNKVKIKNVGQKVIVLSHGLSGMLIYIIHNRFCALHVHYGDGNLVTFVFALRVFVSAGSTIFSCH